MVSKYTCALSAESLGVRERVRRVWLNWTVHVPVSRSLQGNGAEKRDGERLWRCAVSAEDLGVRERVRRVRLNWTVHVPVSRSLQGNGAEKRDGGRFVKGRLEEGAKKRWWEGSEGRPG